MEDFNDIKNYEGKYKINRIGEIYSVKRKRLLKPSPNNKGYLRVILCDSNKKEHSLLVHRLLALTFIENPNNYPIADHINKIRTDNRLENLRWTNYSGSNRNRSRNRKYDLPVGVSKNGNGYQALIYIDKKNIYLGSFETVEEAGKAYSDKYNELMDLF